MLVRYHITITRQALADHISPSALDAILKANLKQDDLLTGQIGHDEYHYDNNAIPESNAYIEEQRTLTHAALYRDDLSTAWATFGRLIHTAQDFYAHSNYVDLWLSQFEDQMLPPPPEIAPVVDEFLRSPGLHSGKLYYPLGILSFIPIIKNFIIPHLPVDSHAHMQLDSPACGLRFDYAFEAAVKRTKHEFDVTVAGLSDGQLARFRGR